MENDETFQIDNYYGEVVQKTIADCVKDFEDELKQAGLSVDLINKERSMEVLHAYINSSPYFEELLERELRNLKMLLPEMSAAYISPIGMGLLKAAMIKFHHKLIQKEQAIDLAVDVFFLSVICRERRMGFYDFEDEAQTSFAKKGAKARHKENHAAKEDVFKWLDENMQSYKSMDDAALAIAEKVVPMKFRTVRQWLTEWKKIRSAGTT